MNDNKSENKGSILTEEGFKYLFGDLKLEKKHKKKKINKPEEKQSASNSKPIDYDKINNILGIKKKPDKSNKKKEFNETKKESQFIGKKRTNENHRIEQKENNDKNKITKINHEKNEKHNYIQLVSFNNRNNNSNNHNDNKIKNRMDISPMQKHNKEGNNNRYDSPKETKIRNDNYKKFSDEKRFKDERDKIRKDINIKKDYISKNEPIKKINNSNSGIKINSNSNINHSINKNNNIKPKEIINKNNDFPRKEKEINKQQYHSEHNNIKMINNNSFKKEYKEDNKCNSPKDKNIGNNIKLKNSLSSDKNKIIKKVEEKHYINDIERKKDIKPKVLNNQNNNNSNINKSKEIDKKSININKSHIEKPHKIINNINPNNKIIPSKMNIMKSNTKPNVNTNTPNSERNKLNNSNQKIKPKSQIPLQSHNIMKNQINNKNKISDNIKYKDHKINNNSSQKNNNINNKSIHNNTKDKFNNNNNKSKLSNNNNNIKHSKDPKIERLKNSLENRRVGPDGKLIHPDKSRQNYNYIPKKTPLRRYESEESDSDLDGFVVKDNEEVNKEYVDFMNKMINFKKSRIKNEIQGDVEEANYDTILAEEEYTKRIGRKEDLEALRQNREFEDDEEEDEEDEY